MLRTSARASSATATSSAGPRPGTDVAVVNTCCVTHEAVRKSRQAAAPAPPGTHGRVYVTGVPAANLAGDAFAGLPDNVTVVARQQRGDSGLHRGDVGSIGCVQSDARLDRVRAFVKIQDGCSFSCNFCVIPLVRAARRAAAPGSSSAGRVRRRVAQGHLGDRPHRYQSRLLSRSRRRLPADAARAGGRRRPGSRPSAPLVDRGQPTSTAASFPHCARPPPSRAICTSLSSRVTTGCSATWRGGIPRRRSSARSRRSLTSTSRRT